MTSTQRTRPLPLSTLRRQSSVATTACDRRALFATLWFALTFLLASCGGRAVSTDTGNPTVNETRIRVTATDTGVLVTGDPGAISPGGATVLVTNDTTDDSVTTTAETDGSFQAEIAGTVDDDIAVDVAAGPPELTGIKWTIVSVTNGDTGAATDDTQFGSITFNVDGTLDLTSECNSGGGSYFVSAEGTLTFSDIVLSQMACPNSPTVTEDILSVMRAGNVTFSVDGNELTLTRGTSSIVAVADLPDPDLDGRSFLLDSAEGYELVQSTMIRLSFENGEISFHAGCNGYSGAYTVCGDALCVESFGATMVGCPAPLSDQDGWVETFLTSQPSFLLVGDQLTLTRNDATLVFIDARIADPDRPLRGSVWTIDTLFEGGTASGLPDLSATIEFGEDATLSVSTGCRGGEGTFTDGEGSSGELTLADVAYAEEPCVPAEREAMSQLIEEVMSAGTLSFSIEGRRLTLERGDIGLSATTE